MVALTALCSFLLIENQHYPRPMRNKLLKLCFLNIRFKKEPVDFRTTRFLYFPIHILILFLLGELHFRTILLHQCYQSKGGQNRVLLRKVSDEPDECEIQSADSFFPFLKYCLEIKALWVHFIQENSLGYTGRTRASEMDLLHPKSTIGLMQSIECA